LFTSTRVVRIVSTQIKIEVEVRNVPLLYRQLRPPTMLLALRKAITLTNKQHGVLVARSERLASRIFSRGARFGQLGRLPLGPSQFRPRLLSVLFTSNRSSD